MAMIALLNATHMIITKRLTITTWLGRSRTILEGQAAVIFGVFGIVTTLLLVADALFVPDHERLLGNHFSLFNIMIFFTFGWVVSLIAKLILRD